MPVSKATLVMLVTGALYVVTALYSTAAAAKRLAYSKNYGVEIYAEEQDSQWCREQLDLRLKGDAESSFDTAKLQTLISKLGKIIVRECPEAASASLAGYYDDTVVYRANIDRQESWMLRPVPVDREGAAGGGSATSTPNAVAAAEARQATQVKAGDTTPAADRVVVSESPAAEPAVTPGGRLEEAAAEAIVAGPVPAAFSVNGWSPVGKGQTVALAEGVREYLIKTRDGSCGVRYSSINEAALVEFLRLDLEDVACKDGYVSGNGKATIRRSDGQLVARLQGEFVQGYNVGFDLKGAPIISRYITNRNQQALSVFLRSDSERKIHYLAQLTGGGDVWGNCRSMMITAVTGDEAAFLDAEQIRPVVQQAGELARELCPNIRQIEFLALSIPAPLRGTGTEAQYFYVTAGRARNKDAWTYNAGHAQNYVINRRLAAAREEQQRAALAEQQRVQQEYQQQLQQQRRAQQIQHDYQRLEAADFASRVAFLHEATRLDNPIAAASRSLIQDKPVSVTILVHVDDADGSKAMADRPSQVNLAAVDALFEDEGWYVITGDLTADGTLDKYGFLVPSIAVSRATRCTDGRCREVGDVLALVRTRYQDDDWSPGQ